MLSKNKFSKYLIYAIGEIALVIIAILIALQINTWNEDRNNSIKEQVLLKELRADFQETKVRLQETLYKQNKAIDYAKLVLEHYEQNKLIDIKDSLPSYVGSGLLSWWRLEPVTRTYASMLSTGDVALIKNKDLIRNLAEFHAEVSSGFEDQIESMDLLNELNKAISKYAFSLRNERLRDYIGLKSRGQLKGGDPLDVASIRKLEQEHAFFDLAAKRLVLEVNRLEQQTMMNHFVDTTLRILKSQISD